MRISGAACGPQKCGFARGMDSYLDSYQGMAKAIPMKPAEEKGFNPRGTVARHCENSRLDV